MRTIDLETWSRREPFKLFTTYGYPHFGLTAEVDLTAFRPAVQQRGHSSTVAMTYVLARAANEIPEFRCRIRGGTVVEHEVVHPAITLLTEDDQLSFCFFSSTRRRLAHLQPAQCKRSPACGKTRPWKTNRDETSGCT